MGLMLYSLMQMRLNDLETFSQIIEPKKQFPQKKKKIDSFCVLGLVGNLTHCIFIEK